MVGYLKPLKSYGFTSGEDHMAERQTVDIEEVAEILGVSRQSAYSAARAGELPVIKIGRRMVVSRAALDALLLAPPQQPAAS